MGSKTRGMRKSKGLLAANGILFKMFQELTLLKEQVLSQHKRLETQDHYLAALEKGFIDKKLFTDKEITAMATAAIAAVKPTKEEQVAAQPKQPVETPSEDVPPCGPIEEEQLPLPNV